MKGYSNTKYYNIVVRKLYETKYINNYKPVISDDFIEYPDLYNLLTKNRNRLIYHLNIFAEELLPKYKHRRGYNSMRYMETKTGKSIKTQQYYKALLCFLRLILRIPPPNQTQIWNCKEYRVKNPYHAEIGYYKQPIYTKELLQSANDRAKLWRQSGMTIRSISKSSFIENFGLDIALEVYPDERIVSDPYFTETSEAIANQLSRMVCLCGYTTKVQIMEEVLFNYPNITKTKFLSTYPAIIQLLVDEQHLSKPHRATKAEVIYYGLDSYKTIITRI